MKRDANLDTPWRRFVRVHMNTLVARDFFTKQVLTPSGVRAACCLFFVHLGSRRVFMCPSAYDPDERWVTQRVRSVRMWFEDESIEARFLLRDCDTKFAPALDLCFRDAGTRIVKAPIQAPNANASAETRMGSVKRECLSHFLCFSLGHLDHILAEYARYYNKHRPHQSPGSRRLAALPERPPPMTDDANIGPIRCQQFLGGLLRHYHRDAA